MVVLVVEGATLDSLSLDLSHGFLFARSVPRLSTSTSPHQPCHLKLIASFDQEMLSCYHLD
jgi:hypothetical protein